MLTQQPEMYRTNFGQNVSNLLKNNTNIQEVVGQNFENMLSSSPQAY